MLLKYRKKGVNLHLETHIFLIIPFLPSSPYFFIGFRVILRFYGCTGELGKGVISDCAERLLGLMRWRPPTAVEFDGVASSADHKKPAPF